jgi:hypothetical protein
MLVRRMLGAIEPVVCSASAHDPLERHDALEIAAVFHADQGIPTEALSARRSAERNVGHQAFP